MSKKVLCKLNEVSPQPLFFSTKKRGKVRTALKLSKPSNQDISHSRMLLLIHETTCCGICFKENDDSAEEYVKWVQCSSCNIWVHLKCAKGLVEDNIEDYVCQICSSDT